jgi:hypothetical protein
MADSSATDSAQTVDLLQRAQHGDQQSGLALLERHRARLGKMVAPLPAQLGEYRGKNRCRFSFPARETVGSVVCTISYGLAKVPAVRDACPTDPGSMVAPAGGPEVPPLFPMGGILEEIQVS